MKKVILVSLVVALLLLSLSASASNMTNNHLSDDYEIINFSQLAREKPEVSGAKNLMLEL